MSCSVYLSVVTFFSCGNLKNTSRVALTRRSNLRVGTSRSPGRCPSPGPAVLLAPMVAAVLSPLSGWDWLVLAIELALKHVGLR